MSAAEGIAVELLLLVMVAPPPPPPVETLLLLLLPLSRGVSSDDMIDMDVDRNNGCRILALGIFRLRTNFLGFENEI